MKVLVFVVATLLVAAGTVSADSKNSLLTAQGGARVGGKQQALQALGVGQGLVKAAVDAEAKVSSAIEDTCTRVPLSVCLGKGEQMLAADAHGKTLVGWWQFDDNSGYDSSGNGGYAKPVPEVGPAQGGVGQVRAGQVRAAQVRTAQLRAAQLRVAQVRVGQGSTSLAALLPINERRGWV